jgi:CRISPR/Cas system-associated exonuclease Cas4 (RecB family)
MAIKQLNLRASASPRWIACPASARLSSLMPYVEGGDAAKIGTAIHALAEHCFKRDLDPMKFEGKVYEGILMTEENCEFALEHLKAIWAIEDELGEGSVIVEKFLPYQDTSKVKVGGTTDVIGISKEKRKIIIADLKTGRGYVSEDNDQLRLYALAALEDEHIYQDIDKIELWIIQPHHGENRVFEMTTQELVDWEHYVLIPAIENALNPAFQPVPSDSACQYCPAKTICPAQANIVETVHVSPPVEMLTEEQISVLLTKFDMVEDYIKAVRDHALKRMESGAVIDGWQLAPKRALRSWTKESEVVPALLGLGLKIEQVVKQEVITPAAAEKLLPKDRKGLIDTLTSRISSGLTLARDKGLSQ